MQSSLARQTHRKCSRLTHVGKYFPQFNGPDRNLGSKRCIHLYLMLCTGLNSLLAQLQRKNLTDMVMNMVPVALCAEPFYCYLWDSLTPSCPVVFTPAVPGNPANTRTLQGHRDANPLREMNLRAQNLIIALLAQLKLTKAMEKNLVHTHPMGLVNSHSHEKCSLLQAHKVRRRHALRRPLKGSHLTGSWTDLKETNSSGLNLMSGLHSGHFPTS